MSRLDFEKRILKAAFLEWWSNRRLPFDRIFQEFLREYRVGSQQRERIQDVAYALIRFWPTEVGMSFNPEKPEQLRSFDTLLENLLGDDEATQKNTEKLVKNHLKFKTRFQKNAAAHLQEAHGLPGFLLQEIRGQETASEWHDYLHTMLEPAPFCVRVAGDRSMAAERSKEFHPQLCSWSSSGLLFPRGTALNQGEMFERGEIEFQDEHSQLVSHLALQNFSKRGPLRILDLCAGAGGKSLHLATLLEGRGEVFAYDISKEKLQRLKIRARKAGLNNIRVTGSLPVKSESFDLVLVDAPCTSFGTIRRNPDRVFVATDAESVRIQQLQSEILLTASGYLKEPGARLAYVTCTVRDSENAGQIHKFLEHKKLLRPVNLEGVLKEYLGLEKFDGFLTALGNCPANKISKLSSLERGTLQWGPSAQQTSGTLTGDGFFFSLVEYAPG